MPSASDWNAYTSENSSSTAAPRNMPMPVPAFFTDDRSSSLASSISPRTIVDRGVEASATRWPTLGSSAVAATGADAAPAVASGGRGVRFGAGLAGLVMPPLHRASAYALVHHSRPAT